jgi:hypothetical protein
MIGFLIAALLVSLMKKPPAHYYTGELIMGVSVKRIVVTGMGIVSPWAAAYSTSGSRCWQESQVLQSLASSWSRYSLQSRWTGSVH